MDAPQILLLNAGLIAASMVLLWLISLRLRDASIVDIFWGPGFVGQLGVALLILGSTGAHGWLVFGLVTVWSARLTAVLLQRRRREGGEDARYQMIRSSWGQKFWWKSFFIVFVLQATVQWLIVLGPIAVLDTQATELSTLAWSGAAVALAGLALETIADRQLDTFKRTAGHDELCADGLRAYVRHPNYAGEIIFWCGIAMIAVEAGAWLGLISPILLVVFLTRVSGAPLIEERLTATRPAYAAYRARVPAFVPRFGSKTG